MKSTKIITGFAIATFVFVMLPKLAKASDGTTELRSTNGEPYHCFAASLFVSNYKILVACRDLIYPRPSNDKVAFYIMWATPLEGDKPIKLGPLNYGRKFFQVGKAFSNLYVTLETKSNVKSPSGEVVMRGTVQPITFLQEPTTPIPTPEAGAVEETTEEAQPTTREKLVTALKRAGVAALFALVALVGLIFVITRSRR